MIENQEFVIKRSEFNDIEELPGLLASKAGHPILRWYISKVANNGREFVIDAALNLRKDGGAVFPGIREDDLYPGKSVVVSIVPTGVGCEIGGYAADAAPATALLASCTDYLITNPNAVNASNFIAMDNNVWYTEGYSIDLFCKGEINLYKPYSNKVGLIVERADQENLEVVYNIVNTARAVHGVDIGGVEVTEARIGGRCVRYNSGAYVGTLDFPDVLLDAAQRLIEKGVNAIGITSNIQDLPGVDYAKHFDGQHPNPVGGAEAIISHLITDVFRVPAAHAPMINVKPLDLTSNIVDARGAGEYASASGLACILIGLARAPQLVRHNNYRIKDVVNINNLLAIVTPSSTLGGVPALYAQKYNIPIIAVKENNTILDVSREKLGLRNVYQVSSYAEAAGYLQALRSGISIESLHRPLHTLRPEWDTQTLQNACKKAENIEEHVLVAKN